MGGHLTIHDAERIAPIVPGRVRTFDPRMFLGVPNAAEKIAFLRGLGVIPGIFGAAQGFHVVGDVITQTADGRDLNHIWAELQEIVRAANEPRDNLVRFLTRRVINPVEDVPVYVTDDFEEASEFGLPHATRQPGQYFSMGYTFKWYDLGARFTWMFLADATQAQIDSSTNTALEADSRLVMNQVLKTVFNNVNLTANIKGVPYNVYKFYNNDGTVPPPYKNNTFLGTHDHYMTSGSATAVRPVDVEAQYLNLSHHGYTEDNGYSVVLMVNTNEGNTIRGFKAGTASATYDFVQAVGQPSAFLPANQVLIGGQPANNIRGMQVIGKYGPIFVVQEDFMPINYMFMFATGGPDNVQNPIAIREHPNAALRGMRLVKGKTPDYPLIDSYWNHGLGSGVRFRGAGSVMQVNRVGAYQIPAAYA